MCLPLSDGAVYEVIVTLPGAEPEVVHLGDKSLQLCARGRTLAASIWVSRLVGAVSLMITAVPKSGGLLDGPLEWPGHVETMANAVVANKKGKKGTPAENLPAKVRSTAIHIYCTLKLVFTHPMPFTPKPAKPPPAPKPAKPPPRVNRELNLGHLAAAVNKSW